MKNNTLSVSGGERIAIDCRLFGSSGIGTFVESVVKAAVVDEDKFFVLIGDTDRLRKYADRGNCAVVDCRHRCFSFGEMFCFPTAVVNSCDAFFTPNFNIPMGIRVPVFSTIHDIVFFDTENFGTRMHRMIIKWYIKRALRVSRAVFTVSEFSRRRIKDRFKTGADIRVVYNGVNEELREYASASGADRCGRNAESRKGLVFLGNLKKHKGLRTLLEAYAKLSASGDRRPLTIIGNVNFRTKDRETISVLGHLDGDNNIRCVRNADNQEVYRIISSAEFLVSPSLYEGFGLPPLEALYLGTNVIISDIPVYKEVYGALKTAASERGVDKLPITFFKAGDADDLYAKICESRFGYVDARAVIDEHYNFERAAKTIVDYICRCTALSSSLCGRES